MDIATHRINGDRIETSPGQQMKCNLSDLPVELKNSIISLIIPKFLYVNVHSYGGEDCDLKCIVEACSNGTRSQAPIEARGWADVQALKMVNSKFNDLIDKQLKFELGNGISSLRVCMAHNDDSHGPISLSNDKSSCLAVNDNFLGLFQVIQFAVPVNLRVDRSVGGPGHCAVVQISQRFCSTWKRLDGGWQLFTSLDPESIRTISEEPEWDERTIEAGDDAAVYLFDLRVQHFCGPLALARIMTNLPPILEDLSVRCVFGRGATRYFRAMQAMTVRVPKAAMRLAESRKRPGDVGWWVTCCSAMSKWESLNWFP